MEYPVNGKVMTVAGRIFDCLFSRVKIFLFSNLKNDFRAESSFAPAFNISRQKQ